jgi:hypothetical protein
MPIGVVIALLFRVESEGPAMQTFLSEAIVLDAALISVLLAGWITWIALRGLFWLLSPVSRPILNPSVQPIRVIANRGQESPRRAA